MGNLEDSLPPPIAVLPTFKDVEEDEIDLQKSSLTHSRKEIYSKTLSKTVNKTSIKATLTLAYCKQY